MLNCYFPAFIMTVKWHLGFLSGGHLLWIIDQNRKLKSKVWFSFVSFCGGKVHFLQPPISFPAYGPGLRRSASGGRSGQHLRLIHFLAARPPTRSVVVRDAKCKHSVDVMTAAYDYWPKLHHKTPRDEGDLSANCSDFARLSRDSIHAAWHDTDTDRTVLSCLGAVWIGHTKDGAQKDVGHY